ncbi:MAG: Ppx/GppA phosphatase family protein [Bryobacteraceae bacterium]|nr:Ppx/GppA phosphatase family protein [Bryobacteraceae bacterium]
MARYAAVDIGSNSVRLLVADVIPGSPWLTLAADREVTRLGASVFETGSISEDAIANVCAVLTRMQATYSKLDVIGVRVVATAAVRDAGNAAEFVERASAAIGATVEVISGQEEARLIHEGVQCRWPQPNSRVLIIDVGGGSAEFIVSRNGELDEGISRPLGAVRLTEVFLRHDPPQPIELRQLDQFIEDKFAPVLRALDGLKFDRVIATSATAAAIVSAVNHIDRSERDAADRKKAKVGQIRKLFKQLSTSDLSMRRRVNGVGPRRAEIIVAGAGVFLRVLESLDLDSMYYCSAGVRDGVIADLNARGVGRELTRLSRQQIHVVEDMCRKYHVNIKYARHVAFLASELYDALHPLHRLPPETGKLLQAASYLHDLGHFVSDTGHHKHSAYLVGNSDLPGFTAQERKLISLVCRYHRRSMPQNRHESFRNLPPEQRRVVTLLTPLMRLAVALNSSQQHRVDEVSCNLTSAGATLSIKGHGDLGLEYWAAERVAPLFSQCYEVPLTVERPRA